MPSAPVGIFFFVVWWLTLREDLSVTSNGLYLFGVALIFAAIIVPGVWAVALVAIGAAITVVAVESGVRP